MLARRIHSPSKTHEEHCYPHDGLVESSEPAIELSLRRGTGKREADATSSVIDDD